MGKILLILVFSILFSCKENVLNPNTYVYKYEQDGKFDTSDINKMMNYRQNQIKETELNDRIQWKNMVLIDSTFLPKNKRSIYIYQYISTDDSYNICYTSKDKTRLVAYSSEESDLSIYYVVKNTEFRKIVLELLKDKKFVSYQQDEKPLPEIETMGGR